MPRKRNKRKILGGHRAMSSTECVGSEIEAVPTEAIVSKPEEVQDMPPPGDVQIVPDSTRRSSEIIQIPPTREEYQDRITKLEEELRIRTEERENFKNHLKQVEIELSTLHKECEAQGESSAYATSVTAPPNTNSSKAANSNPIRKELDREENQQLRGVIANMKTVVKDKTASCTRQVLQIEALETQVAALKEVASLTKGMLSIRNSENEKLKEQIDLMQRKVDSERVRNNAVLKKTELASSLNIQLRTEYQNQVKLIGELREKYEKKISILAGEVTRLRNEQLQEQAIANGEVRGQE